MRALITEYDTGTVSMRDLANRHGLAEEFVKVALRNPAYAGFAQHLGVLHPGAMEPIIDRDTWDRVTAKRESRRFAVGRKPTEHSFLSRRTYCACGSRLRLDGLDGSGQRRLRHLPPLCDTWGTKERRHARKIVEPLRDALSRVQPSETLLQALVDRMHTEAASAPALRGPDTRLLRKNLTNRLANGDITLDAFNAEWTRLDRLDAQAPATTRVQFPPINMDDLRDYYSRFSNGTASEYDWEKLAKSTVERIEYRGTDEIAIALSDEAHERFLCDPKVGLVGGEGLEPPTSSV